MPPSMHENRGGRVVAGITVCSIVVTLIVGLRFYVRLGIIKKLGADDWVLAAALVLTLFSAIILAAATRFGFGSHISLLSLPEITKILKVIWISSLGYGAAVTLMKATVLLQYRRIFPLPNFQRYCDIFLAFVFVWAMTGTLGTLLICLPIERNWNPLKPASCGNRIYFWEAYAILHLITDAFILILPLPLLNTLPLPRVQKGVLIAVFCLGFFTCAISGIRITSLHASLTNTDVTWTAPQTALWSMGEVSCAIICVCVPTLRPLLTRPCKLRRRRQRVKEAREFRNSSERGGKQISEESHLETQPSMHSSTDVDGGLTSEISLDLIIQKPSSCYLKS
ncbi:hypothetical protein N431DRAFT_382891 [Stipitochalara longipes BDJ]|nr:hypothetical protein N431DRAFT_382891 [Stipitochalara longipes BDJ]